MVMAWGDNHGIIESRNLGTKFQQAYATHLNSASNKSVGDEIIQQGIVVSQPGSNYPNYHTAYILPHRDDGAVYEGIVSFTATEPVDVFINHRISLDNATLSQINNTKFDNLFLVYPHIAEQGGAPPAIPFVVDGISPDYEGTTPSSPLYSATMPFIGDALLLGSNKSKPFIVFYDVSANIVEPEIVNHISDAFVNATENPYVSMRN